MEHMFYVPLFHYKVENWDSKKQFLLQLYQSVQEDCEGGVVTTNYYKDCIKIKQDIGNLFHPEIKKFVNAINCKSYNVRNAWFELSTKHNYHGIHNHGPTGYSSVCFVNYDENEHEPTQFVSPFNNFMNGNVLDHNPQNITEGSIIFFPSTINHYTNPSQSDKERLVVSFNLQIL